MKKCTLFLLVLLFATLLAASCKKEKAQDNPTELEMLPPATQTGANTFGCLVNGKAWTVQNKDCSIICDDPFKVFYDGANGGNLTIIGKNIDGAKPINQSIIIGLDSTNYKNTFILNTNNALHLGFTFVNNNLFIRSWDSLVMANGNVMLTKYDLANGIISGNFEFSLIKPNNETINITNGRFDKKF